MRKYQKAAVVMAMVGSVGFVGAGVSHADDPSAQLTNTQSNSCGNESQDGILNIGRVQLNILAVPVASPQDFSHDTTCTNQLALGGE
ncbi:hypothetical protein H0H10_04260 [Streptomyces sp. TRM S81-3]|uniref:Secreted protein n=1 Tax=Streptomyces griseicoloratus TaxID=2752516 RepID=A0A926QN78_9ACTN|nr:hypothetical protein [Streptomyces griseicoloratus]MBD0418389.1 hypothetical protein [Streptomyces griseicoloratus]